MERSSKQWPFGGIFGIIFLLVALCHSLEFDQVLNDHISQKSVTRNEEEVDYIVHRGKFQCVTAFDDGNSGYHVSLSECDMRRTQQQQWILKNNDILFAADSSYYLVPNDEYDDVILKKLEKATHKWIRDNEKFIVEGKNLCLALPHRKSEPVNIGLTGCRISSVPYWLTKSELDEMLVDAPEIEYPIKKKDKNLELKYRQELGRSLINRLTPLTEPLPYPRYLETMPGIVSADAPRINRQLTLDLSAIGQTRNYYTRVPEDWQITGLYAAAGDIVEIIIPSHLSVQKVAQITVRIGEHTEYLSPSSGSVERGGFKRVPIITETFILNAGKNEIRSQYGGNIIFMFSEGEHFKTEITVNNVIESVHFKLGETSIEKWTELKQRKDDLAPNAIFESEKTVVCVPFSQTLEIDNPNNVLNRYDQVIALLNDAAGYDDENDPPPRGKWWIVSDIQLKVGAANAGFPVMLRHAKRIMDYDSAYNWGTWHEFGHVYENDVVNSYGGETTCNLFALYVQEKIFGKDDLREKNRYETTAALVDNGESYDSVDLWQRLVFFMEINNYFPELKWEMFRKLRRMYRENPDEYLSVGGAQSWVYVRLSEIVGHDLIGTYNRWQIKLSKKATKLTADLPKDLPSDLSQRKRN